MATITELLTEDWLDVLGNGGLLKRTVRASPHQHKQGNGGETEEEGKLDMGMRALVHYTARLVGRSNDDVLVEDTRRDRADGKPVQIILGHSDVIPGLDMGIALMRQGEVAQFKIAPRYAYGSRGSSEPAIPAEATLLYEVELLEATHMPDVDDMDPKERVDLADAKKERGNWYFGRNEFDIAVSLYSKGLKFLEGFSSVKAVDGPLVSQAKTITAKLYANLATSQYKLGSDAQAAESCQKCLAIEPNNIKALYRLALIESKQHDYDQAIQHLQLLLQQDPQNTEARLLMQETKQKKQEHEQKEKEMYATMMRGASYDDRPSASSSSSSTDTAINTTTAQQQKEQDDRMPGLHFKQPPKTAFGRWLSSVSPFLGQHYMSPDLYGGLALFIVAVALFYTLVFPS